MAGEHERMTAASVVDRNQNVSVARPEILQQLPNQSSLNGRLVSRRDQDRLHILWKRLQASPDGTQHVTSSIGVFDKGYRPTSQSFAKSLVPRANHHDHPVNRSSEERIHHASNHFRMR